MSLSGILKIRALAQKEMKNDCIIKGRVGNYREARNSELALKTEDPTLHSVSKDAPPPKHMNTHSRVCKASQDERR